MGFTKQTLATLVSLALITACGGGSAPIGGGTTDGGTDSGTSGASATYTLALSLKACDDVATLSTCKEQSTLPADKPNLVEATVLNEKSQPVQGAVVDASTDTYKIGVIQAPARTMTDTQGKARFTLVADAANGNEVGNVAVTAKFTGSDGIEKSLTKNKNFSFGALNLTMELTTNVSELAANGTAAITAKLFNNGEPYTTPVTVTFSSLCATNSSATLDSSKISSNGIALATYKGSYTSADGTSSSSCNGDDTVTANVGSLQKSLVISNVQTLAAAILADDPSDSVIYIPGSGLKSYATVSFKVTDSDGRPKSGELVDFYLEGINTSTEGYDNYSVSPKQAMTNSDGKVTTTVNAGTLPTSVVVAAKHHANNQIKIANSKSIAVALGLPTQRGFSFYADKYNLDGWLKNDSEAKITISITDRQGHPVKNDTKVYLYTNYGLIKGDLNSSTGITGYCITKNGFCNATLITTDPKPATGRVEVLAYTVGEESFSDLNGNLLFDTTDKRYDDDQKPDVDEPYLDVNDNGNFDQGTDQPFDLDQSGGYSPADSKFTGLFCSSSTLASGLCEQKSVHVYDNRQFKFTGLQGGNGADPQILIQECSTSDSSNATDEDSKTTTAKANCWPIPRPLCVDSNDVDADKTGKYDPKEGIYTCDRYACNDATDEVKDNCPKSGVKAVTSVTIGSSAKYMRFMPRVVMRDTKTSDILAINPIPGDSDLTISNDNGTAAESCCGGTSYTSKYPGNWKEPDWFWFQIKPEKTPNDVHDGDLKITAKSGNTSITSQPINVHD